MERVKYVKDYISDSLLDLMKKKQYSEITITDIVNHAGVGRKSFYRNYENKEEILVNKIQEITDDFIKRTNIGSIKSLEQKIVLIFKHMKEQDNICSLYYKNDVMYIIENIFVKTVLMFDKDLPNEYANFMAGGYYSLYFYWFRTGYKGTPEELAKTIDKYFKVI